MRYPLSLKSLCAVTLILVAPSMSAAQSMSSMTAAVNLGSVLAAESFCGLTYDQDAISAWIDTNTDPGDMGFASSLSMMTDGASYELQGMSDSSRTAHCRSIERTARHYGFID